jgi:hypothetical protein
MNFDKRSGERGDRGSLPSSCFAKRLPSPVSFSLAWEHDAKVEATIATVAAPEKAPSFVQVSIAVVRIRLAPKYWALF